MKKVFLFLTIMLLPMTFFHSAAAEQSAALLDCKSTYTSSFNASIELDTLNFKQQAVGFLDVLELANKIGLAKDKLFSSVEYKYLRSSCTWEYTYGRISCFAKQAVLLFTNKAGLTETVIVQKLNVQAGVLGFGKDSRQHISVSFDAGAKEVSAKSEYSASYSSSADGSNGWFICGRPAN